MIEQPAANSLSELADPRGLVAEFQSGLSALTHSWTVKSLDGRVLARTVRILKGGRLRRGIGKALAATGMDAGNDFAVELHSEEGNLLARCTTTNDASATVTILAEDGTVLVSSVREKTLLLRPKNDDALTVFDGAGESAARVQLSGDGPWEVHNTEGAVVGSLVAGDPGKAATASLADWVLLPEYALSISALGSTQHLGVRRVGRYVFVPSPRSAEMPLALSLLPLMAALSY